MCLGQGTGYQLNTESNAHNNNNNDDDDDDDDDSDNDNHNHHNNNNNNNNNNSLCLPNQFKGIIDTFSCGLVLTLAFCTFYRSTVHEIWPSQ